MPAKRQQVVPNLKGGWTVRNVGATRATRVFHSQADAVAYAKGKARSEGAILYIHGKDGLVKDRIAYGDDPLRRSR